MDGGTKEEDRGIELGRLQGYIGGWGHGIGKCVLTALWDDRPEDSLFTGDGERR